MLKQKGTAMSEQLNSLLDDEQDPVVEDLNPEEGAGEAEPEELEEQTDESGDDGEPAPQPPEENHKFAEFRKKHERELAEAKAEADRKQQMLDNLFSKTVKGEINPYTNKPIETLEDVEAWAAEEEKRKLESAGLSPDYLNEVIANNPVVKQASAIIAHNQEIQSQIAINREIAEIQKLNPKIKTIEDLIAENGDDEAFNAMVKGGMPLSKAYSIVHKIPQKKQDTKTHLQTVGGGEPSGTGKEIPASDLSTWKEAFPDETATQLRARYNRFLKRQN